MEHDGVADRVSLRIDEHERDGSHHLRLPVGEDEALHFPIRLEEHPLRGHDRGRLVERQRDILPLGGEEGEEIGKSLRLDLLLEADRHERIWGWLEFVDLVALDRMPLPLGVDQLHGCPALGGEEPRDDAAVVGGHRPGAVIALDGAVGIEDVDEELLRRMNRHPGQLRPDFSPFAGMGVALAALLLEERLAARHVASGKDDGKDFVDHLLAVGARQAAPLGDHLSGALADRAVGMLGELAAFHQRHIGDGDRARLEPVNELGGPLPIGKHRTERGIADGRRERRELVENQPCGLRCR